MGFKYASAHQGAKDKPCPCDKFLPRAVTAFRWVRSSVTEQDFLPIALIGNARSTYECEDFSLSFFATEAAARSRWVDIAKRLGSRAGSAHQGYAAAARDYGDHIATVDLLSSDGACDLPSRKGHFELHENEGVSFVDRVKVYVPIVQDPPDASS